MARNGRPTFKPTKAQRDDVMRLRADGWTQERLARLIRINVHTLLKHFADELEHAADVKGAAYIAMAEKAAKKGQGWAIRWLHDRAETARTSQSLDARAEAQPPEATPPEQRPPKIGKKEQQHLDAGEVAGKFKPPAGPARLH